MPDRCQQGCRSRLGIMVTGGKLCFDLPLFGVSLCLCRIAQLTVLLRPIHAYDRVKRVERACRESADATKHGYDGQLVSAGVRHWEPSSCPELDATVWKLGLRHSQTAIAKFHALLAYNCSRTPEYQNTDTCIKRRLEPRAGVACNIVSTFRFCTLVEPGKCSVGGRDIN